MARSTVAVKFTGDTASLKGALNEVDGKLGAVGSKIAGFAKAAAVGFAAVGGAAIVGAKQAIDAASNLNETLSKSNTIFKEQGASIEHWADGAAKSIGQSKQQALEAAGTFGNMFVQLGIGRDKAAGMSTKMTELASDFASFHNADISDVLEAQTAAFRGEYDAVQKYVPTINAAAVEQKALEMGLKGSSKELTAQDKALATQALLLEGAGDAAGDFARTSDGLANKQRILSARFEDIKAKIGTALIPVAATLASLVADKLLPAFEKLGPVVKQVGMFFNSLFSGFTEDEGTPVESVALKIRAALEGVVQWVQANWPKIQEVIGQVMTTVGSVISGVVDVITTLWNNFGNNIMEVIQRIWPRVQQIIEGALNIIQGIVKTVTALIHGDWSGVWEGIKQVVTGAWSAIQGIVGGALELLRGAIGVALEVIGSVFKGAWDGIVSFVTGIPGRLVGALASLAGLLGGVARTAMTAFLNAHKEVAEQVFKFVTGVPGKVIDALGDVSKLLYNAGKAIMESLLNGIKAGFKAVGHFVGGVAGKIADLKGPLDYDAKLLIPHGTAIMQSLLDGLRARYRPLLDFVSKVADAVSSQVQGGLSGRGTGMVKVGDVSEGQWQRLLAEGWKGRADDGMEALYAPSAPSGAPQQSDVADLLRQILAALSIPAPVYIDKVKVGEQVRGHLEAVFLRTGVRVPV